MQTEYMFTANELPDFNQKPNNNMGSTKMNWVALIVSILITLTKLITDNDALITNFNFTDTTMSILKLVAYVISPLVMAYNVSQISKKRAA